MVINKKIVRTMLQSKSQYVGTLLLIIISCLIYTMFNELTSNISNITSSFEKNYIQEDANFVADKKLDGIQELESKFNMIIEETSSFDYQISHEKTLRIFRQNMKVNIPAIIEGQELVDGDILIDPAYARSNRLKIGDSISINKHSFRISGFMSLPNYIYPLKADNDMINDSRSFGIAVIKGADYNTLSKSNNNFYSVKFKDTQNSLDNVIAEFKEYIKKENVNILKWNDTSENPRVTFLYGKIDSIKQMSASLPIAILILSCILSGMVMWRMLKREVSIIGTLYAYGYKKGEILKHYMNYMLIIALVGGIIGTTLGALSVRPMLSSLVMFFNMPVDAVNFSLPYIIISILLPVVSLSICGYIVVNKVLRNSPVQLIKGGKSQSKVGIIERSLKLEKCKFSTRFKIREQLRNIPRSTFLLSGVILATMLLLLGFAMESSMDFLMKDTYENTYKYKYQYTFNSLQKGQSVNGEAISTSPFTLKSDSKTSIIVMGISPNSKLIELKDKSGNKLSTDKVIITRTLAEKLKIKDQHTIKVLSKFDAKEYSITVECVADTYTGKYIYMPLSKYNELFKYPAESYNGLWTKDKQNIPDNMLINVTTIKDIKNSFKSMTALLQAYISALSTLSFIIGILVIYIVTSLIVEENRENISLLKILGYKKKEIYSLILNSSTFLIVIGYIIGIPLLRLTLSTMLNTVSSSMNFTFPIKISNIYILLGFIITLVMFEISKALSKRKVNKISMNEALRANID